MALLKAAVQVGQPHPADDVCAQGEVSGNSFLSLPTAVTPTRERVAYRPAEGAKEEAGPIGNQVCDVMGDAVLVVGDLPAETTLGARRVVVSDPDRTGSP